MERVALVVALIAFAAGTLALLRMLLRSFRSAAANKPSGSDPER